MHKTMTWIMIGLSLTLLCQPGWAMGNKVSRAANDLGNNDAAQQAAGDAGAAIFKKGAEQIDDAYVYINNGVDNGRVQKMLQNGNNIAAGGKILEVTGKAAPHVGWVATSAGRAYEGDYTGATIEAVNGGTRTAAVGYVGTAAGVWAGGKLGAMAGSWGGPVGAVGGFVIGCGAAWLGGKIWDESVGKGANALDQKMHDWKAESQYAGNPGPRDGWDYNPGNDSAITGGNVAGGTADISRDTAQQVGRSSRPRPPRPGGGSGGSGGGCVCP